MSGHNPAEKHQCSVTTKQIKGVSLLVAYQLKIDFAWTKRSG